MISIWKVQKENLMDQYGVKVSLYIAYETTWMIPVTYFSKLFKQSRKLANMRTI
jgi:hypothetical protein